MAVIGIISIVAILLCLLAVIITGRKLWLVIWIWCLPIVGMAYFAPYDYPINGLVVVISMFMVIITAYSLWGVKAWYVPERKKKYIYWTVLFALNYAVIEYYFYQCIYLGYVGFLNINRDMPFIYIATVLITLFVSVLMSKIMTTSIDKYFSKKETFVIIECQPAKKNKDSRVGQNRKCTIVGVQNGKEYMFNMTRKAYFLLKLKKSLVMEVRHGIMGGFYVTSDLYKNEDRRNKRINKILVRQCAFAVLTVVIFILFVARIKLGLSFEEIFAGIQKNMFK